MSSIHAKQVTSTQGSHLGILGVGGALLAVTAVGTAVAVFLAPPSAPVVPANPPAAARSYATLPTIGEMPEYIDARVVSTLAKSYAHLPTIGEVPEYVDGRSAVPAYDARFDGYFDRLAKIGEVPEYVDGRAEGAPARSYTDLPMLPGPTGLAGE